jgi:hypothetical protein
VDMHVDQARFGHGRSYWRDDRRVVPLFFGRDGARPSRGAA